MIRSRKDTDVLVKHGTSLELPLEYQQDYLTPVERFFVCNSGSSPQITTVEYSLRIWGDGVERELVLSYSELEAMQQHSVAAVMECAGNHRALFQEVDGKKIETPAGTAELIWSTGAVGMALWRGVPLSAVLRLAGLKDQAVHVCPAGSEEDSVEGVVRMPMPMGKALDPDTLLALQMNSQSLTVEHGHPVRVMVPGWIGAFSIKWVQDIEVSCKKIWVKRNTESYVMMGNAWPAKNYAPSMGMPLTSLNIKSALALPRPAQLHSAMHHLHGYARSPGSKIVRVQWSDNNGQAWSDAGLVGDNEKYGWVRFEFNWQARPGKYNLMTKATDDSGLIQPDKVPFNTAGYLYNAVHPHAVIVSYLDQDAQQE